MSFKIIEQAKPRLNRSELAVPGSNPALFEKAAESAVDCCHSGACPPAAATIGPATVDAA